MKTKTRYSSCIRLACSLAMIISSCASQKTSVAAGQKAGALPAGSTSFFVKSVMPDGEISSSVVHPSIQVLFSEPVVALSKLGEPMPECENVTITPKLDGVFRWYGTSLLSFDCADKLIPQKEYTVEINPAARSVGGTPLCGAVSFSFRTEELRITGIEPGFSAEKNPVPYFSAGDVPPEFAREIAVTFSNSVNHKVVSKSIRIASKKKGAEKEFPFSCRKIDGRKILLSVKEPLPVDSEISVVLEKGARPDKGCIETSAEQTLSFHTLRPLSVTDSYAPCEGELVILFNHNLMKGTERGAIGSISFSPAMEMREGSVEARGKSLRITGIPAKAGESYSFEIAEGGVTDVWKQGLPKTVRKKITVPPAETTVSFKSYGPSVIEAAFEPRFSFAFVNIGKGSSYSLTALTGKKTGMKETFLLDGDIEGNANRRVVKSVELTPFLDAAGGRFYGAVEFENSVFVGGVRKDEYEEKRFMQITDLGAVVHLSENGLSVLVTSLSSGKPVRDALVRIKSVTEPAHRLDDVRAILSGNGTEIARAKTDDEGLSSVRFSVPDGQKTYAEITAGADRLVVFLDSWQVTRLLSGKKKSATAVPMVFCDRGVYKPGETVTCKIIDRTLSRGEYSTYTGGFELSFASGYGKKRTVFATERGTMSANGTADGKWKIPADAAPGTYGIEYKRDDGMSFTQEIEVQFFERLRFQSAAEIPDMAFVRGDTVQATVSASYLGGGALSGAAARAEWGRRRTTFSADVGIDGCVFGRSGRNGFVMDDEDYFSDESESRLGQDGTARFSVKADGGIEGAPYVYSVQALVTDAGNQMIASSSSATVHPASFYIGLFPKNGNGWLKKGEKTSFGFFPISCDKNTDCGELVGAKKSVSWKILRKTFVRMTETDDFGFEKSRWVEKISEECSGTGKLSGTSAGNPGSISFTPAEGGNYLLSAETRDGGGRKVITELPFFVPWGDGGGWREEGFGMTSMTDKKMYRPGETARIMLSGNIPDGRCLVTVERAGVVLSEHAAVFSGKTCEIAVPVLESYSPVIHVRVSAVVKRTDAPPSDYDAEDKGMPASTVAVVSIPVSDEERTFDIGVTADKKVHRPGETARVTMKASKNGRPVSGAELTLMVVDRGVIDLTGYRVPSPVMSFYGAHHFPAESASSSSYGSIIPPTLFGTYATSVPGGMMVYDNMYGSEFAKNGPMESRVMLKKSDAKSPGGLSEKKTAVRQDFRALAAFIPTIITGDDGTAEASFVLPDTLTDYMLTVVGVKEQSFALAEDSLSVANPVSVREFSTRILRPGDRGEAGVVVTNSGVGDENVTVGLSITSGDIVSGGSGRIPGTARISGSGTKTVKVGAGRTQPVGFSIDAVGEGWVTLEFSIKCGALDEIVRKAVEIERPYIFESVTTVGQVADGEKTREEIVVFPDSGGEFSIEIGSSRLGTLRSAIDYVFRYPYGCLEQRSSAIIPLIAFGNRIGEFGLSSEVGDAKGFVEKEIAGWASCQKRDGGFPYWRDGTESSLAVSMRIAEVIALARKHGMAVPSALNVGELLAYIGRESENQKAEGRHGLFARAYSLYVRSCLGGKADAAEIGSIIGNKDAGVCELAFAGLAALNSSEEDFAKKAASRIAGRIALTTRGVSIQTQESENTWHFFGSGTEQLALALQLFSAVEPSGIHAGNIVWELLQMQKAGNGRWQSTATTGRVLIALDSYISAAKLDETDFTGTATLLGTEILSAHFSGTAAKNASSAWKLGTGDGKRLPDGIAAGERIPLSFKKEGKGTLFYTAGMTYSLPAGGQAARDEGLSVFVEITDARTGKAVKNGKLESGKMYRETVRITSQKNRTFVAVRAPVPAGAEILNAAFATTASVGAKARKMARWWAPSSHQEIRDAEVRCFWDDFPLGSRSFEFVFRANRSGTYGTPSAVAECMYEPEVFGRSAGTVWSIK